MKIALLGYGKMGHAIEAVALKRGHEIVCTIDNADELAAKANRLKEADVAIEFTMPSVAADNIRYCIENDIAIVCGTTGWYDSYNELTTLCHKRGGAMLTATNFSIGMNIMFALNERLARLMSGRDEYAVDITEIHHIHKLDAPSGTAITLRDQIVALRGSGEQAAGEEACVPGGEQYAGEDACVSGREQTAGEDACVPGREQTAGEDACVPGGEKAAGVQSSTGASDPACVPGGEIPITSVREGEVAGTHTVRYSSTIDTITLTHEAHSREGLAQGAVIAAEFLAEKKGVFTMKDVLGMS